MASEVKIGKKPAASVQTPQGGAQNMFVDSDDTIKVKLGDGTVQPLGGGATPGQFGDLTTAMIDGLKAAKSPLSASNGAASAADLQPLAAITGLFTKLTADPSCGQGVAQQAPRLGIRAAGGGTELWIKTGMKATDWTRIFPPCGAMPATEAAKPATESPKKS